MYSYTTAGDREKYGTYKHDAATDLSSADQRYSATGAGKVYDGGSVSGWGVGELGSRGVGIVIRMW